MPYIKRNKDAWGRGKKQDPVGVLRTDLKALLFWAAVGVSGSRGGAYERDIENIIESYAQHIAFDRFASNPRFKK